MIDQIEKKRGNRLESMQGEYATFQCLARDSVRASIRIKIKRLLRKYKYPPEKTDEAIALVLEQAETLSESWVS